MVLENNPRAERTWCDSKDKEEDDEEKEDGLRPTSNDGGDYIKKT